MTLRTVQILTASLAVLSCSIVQAESAESYQQCLLEKLAVATPDTTVGALKSQCRKNAQPEEIGVAIADRTPFEERMAIEIETRDELFVISPHHPNYLLPVSYNFSDNTVAHNGKDIELNETEVQFQISLKAPVAQSLFTEHDAIYAAYTNRSWWQAYNKDISSPFRETNHEPELFYTLSTDFSLLGMQVRNLQLGLNHQSNGRSGDLSRSWNRVYASMLLEKGNFYINVKPWLRLSEKTKKTPDDPNGDDNPNIMKYMGNGELTMFYKFQNDHTLNLMLRNNLRRDNKGALQLGWSFPMSDRLRGYVQYFNGYGESLIDYDQSVSRLSLGFMLTDWL